MRIKGRVSLESDRVLVMMVSTDDFDDSQVDQIVALIDGFAHESVDVPEIQREDGAIVVTSGPEPLGSERTAAFLGWTVHTMIRIEDEADIAIVVEVNDLRTDLGL